MIVSTGTYDATFDYIETRSQSLAADMEQCGRSNDALSAFFDGMYGPDATDTFDASCNTCKHFVRRPMTPDEKKERNIFGMPGECAMKLVRVRGWQRGQFCGYENALCYENRRTGKRPCEAFSKEQP